MILKVLTVYHLDLKPRLLVISLVAQHRQVYLPAEFLGMTVVLASQCFSLLNSGKELEWESGFELSALKR
jgi:hypothetical protein